ncbi:putative membrane protein [Anaplasma phagocytophilum str. ApWI1]|uniref:Putative membrane protein n=2 Tax=Anaplasma phagocytophilum TaxID=948 RepID=A0A0F3MUE9_ANAPH|nr:putative membrane protein [Anaplasma phagocytophilum str. NCH-1]KJV83268.1 putative membrane protein [Anaplasma phagocytophilum str. HGE2]KJV84933.1 putative membrane protein [Anaplasma phagocytophilum str. ApWI1]KJV86797.1 putative membrane protein [Anaplasma phagocytophilum str. ApNYW]
MKGCCYVIVASSDLCWIRVVCAFCYLGYVFVFPVNFLQSSV